MLGKKVFIFFVGGILVLNGIRVMGDSVSQTFEASRERETYSSSSASASENEEHEDKVLSSPNNNNSSTSEREPRATESSDMGLAGRTFNIVPFGGSQGCLGNAGSVDVAVVGSFNGWFFRYTGSANDSYYITDNVAGTWEYIELSGSKVRKTVTPSKKSEWRVIRLSDGYKIVNVAYSNQCLTFSGNGAIGSTISSTTWKGQSSQKWMLQSSDTTVFEKFFYVPVNTKKTISSGSEASDIIWYSGGRVVESGKELHVAPKGDDVSAREYVAKSGGKTLRSVWIISEQYNYTNQDDFNNLVTISSPASSWTPPEDLVIPEETYRYNVRTNRVEKYRVNRIGSKAFEGSRVISVTLPNTLDFIGFSAFNSNFLGKINYISSDIILEKDSFRRGTNGCMISEIVTDDPEVFSRRVPKEAFNGYDFQKVALWKKGEVGVTITYGAGVLLNNEISEGSSLSLSVDVNYPSSAYLRSPLEVATTAFRNASECWRDYHSFQWYKDGVALVDQVSPMLKLSSVKSKDAGSYYAMVDGKRVEGDKKIDVRVKVDNKNPSAPEPSNPDSWINIKIPMRMEFHSTPKSDYTQIEGSPGEVVNFSGRSVRIEVSDFSVLENQDKLKGIKSLELEASGGKKVDLKNFKKGRETALVTLSNAKGSTSSTLMRISGNVDTSLKQFTKYKMNFSLKFVPLDKNGQPYS